MHCGMKLVCSQADLNANLQLTSRAISSRPTHPVLANVLLTADAGTGRVSLTAFDLSLGIQTSFAADVQEPGAITLPARLLADIVAKLADAAPLTLQCCAGDEQVDLIASTGNYHVRGMASDDFPELPMVQTGDSLSLPIRALVEGLQATLFATSPDESKQILTGVHLKVCGPALEFAATDGHRLAVLCNGGSATEDDGAGFAVTVPGRALRELERMLASHLSSSAADAEDSVNLYRDQGQVVFQWADQVVTSRTLDGNYPRYGELIPTRFDRSILLDRRLLIASLERIAVLADQKNSIVKFRSDPAVGQLHLSADAQDVGRGEESIAAGLDGDGLEVAFNVRYVLEGLRSFTGPDTRLCLNSATSPAVLQPEGSDQDLRYLVMPVQIRS